MTDGRSSHDWDAREQEFLHSDERKRFELATKGSAEQFLEVYSYAQEKCPETAEWMLWHLERRGYA